MNAVIYARVSSAASGAGSVDDQIALCRERCEREGWVVVDVFADQASGGNAGVDVTARPGIDAMLVRIEAGGIAQVVVETTDRIARNQEGARLVRERVKLGGARLVTLSGDYAPDVSSIIRELLDKGTRRDLLASIKQGERATASNGPQSNLAV